MKGILRKEPENIGTFLDEDVESVRGAYKKDEFGAFSKPVIRYDFWFSYMVRIQDSSILVLQVRRLRHTEVK